MLVFMTRLIISLACLACMSHGQQAESSTQNLLRGSPTTVQSPLYKGRAGGSSLRAVAQLLLGDSPIAGFSPLGTSLSSSRPVALKPGSRNGFSVPIMADLSRFLAIDSDNAQLTTAGAHEDYEFQPSSAFAKAIHESAVARITQYRQTNELKENGEPIWDNGYQMMKDTLGETDPDTLIFKAELAKAKMRNKPGDKKALRMMHEVKDAYASTFADNHPATLATKADLATMLERYDQAEKAEELRQEIAEAEPWQPPEEEEEEAKEDDFEDDDEYESFEVGEQWGQEAEGEFFRMTMRAKNLMLEGKQMDSEQTYREMWQVITRHFGSDHQSALWIWERMISMNGLPVQNKKSTEYEDMLRQILKVKTLKFGATHEEVLFTKNYLAHLLADRRRGYDLQDATKMRTDILKAKMKRFGPKSRQTLYSKGLLAQTLRMLGNDAGAEKLQREVVDACVQRLGADDDMTLQNEYELARMLSAKSATGRELFGKVLEAWNRTKGPEHPDTLVVKADLAGEPLQTKFEELLGPDPRPVVTDEILEAKARQHPERISLQQDLLAFKEQKVRLGPSDRTTLYYQSKLAQHFIKVIDPETAVEIRKDILKVQLDNIGPAHADTFNGVGKFVGTLKAAKKLEEAEQMLRALVHVTSRSRGLESPMTLNSKYALVRHLVTMRDLDSAKALQEQILETQLWITGPNHPGALTAKGKLSEILKAQGNMRGVLELHTQMADTVEYVLGAGHPESHDAKLNVASTLFKMEAIEGSLKLLEEVLKVREQILGPENRETLFVKHQLGRTLSRYEVGRYEEAEKLQREVLEDRVRLFGLHHPDTVEAKNQLSITVGRISKAKEDALAAEEAKELSEEYCEDIKKRESMYQLNALLEAKGWNPQQLVWPEKYTLYPRKKKTERDVLQDAMEIKVLKTWTRTRKPKHLQTEEDLLASVA
mmetsp:Transcript_76428/g.139227  ORF Transcript_76428/g.139227 Transcript_76428/m.139227 type:complete len:939 (-) Transcript_76428:202-3018(-)